MLYNFSDPISDEDLISKKNKLKSLKVVKSKADGGMGDGSLDSGGVSVGGMNVCCVMLCMMMWMMLCVMLLMMVLVVVRCNDWFLVFSFGLWWMDRHMNKWTDIGGCRVACFFGWSVFFLGHLVISALCPGLSKAKSQEPDKLYN